MLFGYNTNGFAHHRLVDALDILADLGYGSVAITLDYQALNPYDENLRSQIEVVRGKLRERGLRSVIETGARYLLDPWRKHQPTLISDDVCERERREVFLRRAADIACELGADAVSFWSGSPRAEAASDIVMSRLVEGCGRLCDYAAQHDIRLAFEPEPGMFIDTMDKFEELHDRVGHPSFGLTIDIGHLQCQAEIPIGAHLKRWQDRLWNIHIEDMCRGVHEHLMFGEGEIEFGTVLRTLKAMDYRGGIHVELSRHSADAVETARRALAFLRSVETTGA
jgi:L-ribulose-5-phosphate 3-epimerase